MDIQVTTKKNVTFESNKTNTRPSHKCKCSKFRNKREMFNCFYCNNVVCINCLLIKYNYHFKTNIYRCLDCD
jgi:hypothetical protein